MKTYNPLERKSAGGLPATPREKPNVDTATLGTRTTPAQAASGEGEPPASDLEPGEFPLHALSPAMRDMAEDLANVHRVPVQLPAMCAVGILSGALGNAYTLTGAVDGKDCFGNLYVIPAAPKSSGKGSVANALAKPLLTASGELEAAFFVPRAARAGGLSPGGSFAGATGAFACGARAVRRVAPCLRATVFFAMAGPPPTTLASVHGPVPISRPRQTSIATVAGVRRCGKARGSPADRRRGQWRQCLERGSGPAVRSA